MEYLLTGFNGERLDLISGHYHLGYGSRGYSPLLRCFSAPDSWSPFGAGGINSYVYCDGDPVNRSDPSGHFSHGQSIGMALGFMAGIMLDIFTEGAAMPVVLTLMATVAGDAVIGAGAELTTEAMDGRRISWAQVGIAAGLNVGTNLMGFGMRRAARQLTRLYESGGEHAMRALSKLKRVNGKIGIPLSGEFRNARFLGRNLTDGEVSWNLSFEDNIPSGTRLNIIMAGYWEGHELQVNNEVWNDVLVNWNAGYFTQYPASGLRNLVVPRNAYFAEYRLAMTDSAIAQGAGGRRRPFASNFLRRANQPCSVIGYRGVVSTDGPVADALRQTYRLLNDMERHHFHLVGHDIPQNFLNGLSEQYRDIENAIIFNGNAFRYGD